MMAPDEGMKNKRRILAAERGFRQPESWLRIQSEIFAKPASIGATVALYRVSGCPPPQNKNRATQATRFCSDYLAVST